MSNLKRTRKLIGKPIEVVPWWQEWGEGSPLTGVLMNIRGVREHAKGRPPKKAEESVFVIKPSRESRRILRESGLMKPSQKTVIRLVSGHKIRGQMNLMELLGVRS